MASSTSHVSLESMANICKNAIGQLQNVARKLKLAAPEITVLRTGGEDHSPVFEAVCEWDKNLVERASAGSKIGAKRLSAFYMLRRLDNLKIDITFESKSKNKKQGPKPQVPKFEPITPTSNGNSNYFYIDRGGSTKAHPLHSFGNSNIDAPPVVHTPYVPPTRKSEDFSYMDAPGMPFPPPPQHGAHPSTSKYPRDPYQPPQLVGSLHPTNSRHSADSYPPFQHEADPYPPSQRVRNSHPSTSAHLANTRSPYTRHDENGHYQNQRRGPYHRPNGYSDPSRHQEFGRSAGGSSNYHHQRRHSNARYANEVNGRGAHSQRSSDNYDYSSRSRRQYRPNNSAPPGNGNTGQNFQGAPRPRFAHAMGSSSSKPDLTRELPPIRRRDSNGNLSDPRLKLKHKKSANGQCPVVKEISFYELAVTGKRKIDDSAEKAIALEEKENA